MPFGLDHPQGNSCSASPQAKQLKKNQKLMNLSSNLKIQAS